MKIKPVVECIVESLPAFQPGVIVEVPEELGRALVERGQAEAVTTKKESSRS
jgi:hypothetical protein